MNTLNTPSRPGTSDTCAQSRSELVLFDRWNSGLVRELIERKTKLGRKPSFLFLGHHEAELLRRHLGSAFGPESVQTLNKLYYMGLEVIELDTPSYLRTAGMKRVEGLCEALNRKPGWRELEASGFWHFAIR